MYCRIGNWKLQSMKGLRSTVNLKISSHCRMLLKVPRNVSQVCLLVPPFQFGRRQAAVVSLQNSFPPVTSPFDTSNEFNLLAISSTVTCDAFLYPFLFFSFFGISVSENEQHQQNPPDDAESASTTSFSYDLYHPYQQRPQVTSSSTSMSSNNYFSGHHDEKYRPILRPRPSICFNCTPRPTTTPPRIFSNYVTTTTESVYNLYPDDNKINYKIPPNYNRTPKPKPTTPYRPQPPTTSMYPTSSSKPTQHFNLNPNDINSNEVFDNPSSQNKGN